MKVISLHLKELSYRTAYLALSYLLALIYAFSKAQVFLFLLLHETGLENRSKHFLCTYIGEAFSGSLLISVHVALALVFPLAIHQAWSYARPGKHYLPAIQNPIGGKLKTIKGVSYLLASVVALRRGIPLVLDFFLGYEKALQTAFHSLQTQPRLLPTIWFTLRTLVLFSLLLFGGWFLPKLVSLTGFRHKAEETPGIRPPFRPYAYVMAFLFASMLAPPEISAQICLTLPILLVVEFSLIRAIYLQIQHQMRKHHLRKHVKTYAKTENLT